MNKLDKDTLKRLVPSAFTAERSENTSDRYTHIPTIDIIEGMERAGYFPVLATQSRGRLEETKNFTKHLIRFRREDSETVFGNVPEIVLINSHDGKSSYQLRAGVYRLVCTNGMIVGDECAGVKIRHKGNVIPDVIEAANHIIETVPKFISRARVFEGIELDSEERHAYANSAAMLKWDDECPVNTSQLLMPKRMADCKQDLWTTFNIVQENIIRGGLRYKARSSGGSRQSTRKTTSVSENVRLNTALWNLTETMSQLKGYAMKL